MSRLCSSQTSRIESRRMLMDLHAQHHGADVAEHFDEKLAAGSIVNGIVEHGAEFEKSIQGEVLADVTRLEQLIRLGPDLLQVGDFFCGDARACQLNGMNFEDGAQTRKDPG